MFGELWRAIKRFFGWKESGGRCWSCKRDQYQSTDHFACKWCGAPMFPAPKIESSTQKPALPKREILYKMALERSKQIKSGIDRDPPT